MIKQDQSSQQIQSQITQRIQQQQKKKFDIKKQKQIPGFISQQTIEQVNKCLTKIKAEKTFQIRDLKLQLKKLVFGGKYFQDKDQYDNSNQIIKSFIINVLEKFHDLMIKYNNICMILEQNMKVNDNNRDQKKQPFSSPKSVFNQQNDRNQKQKIDKFSQKNYQSEIYEPNKTKNQKKFQIKVYYGEKGDKYYGQWSNGKYEGIGVYYDTKGGRYEGEWKAGLRQGRGIQYNKYGDRYDGQFRNDIMQGMGIYLYRNGDRYDGEWKKGFRDGKGTKYYINGGKFDGYWKNGLKHGTGTYHYINGKKYECEWDNDEILKTGQFHQN